MQRRDAEALEASAESDLALLDHRAVGLPSMTRQELMDVYRTMDALPEGGQAGALELFAEGGAANLKSLKVRELESIW